MSTKTIVKKKSKTRAIPVEQSQKLLDLARTIRRTYDTTEKLLMQAQKLGTETIAEAIQCGKALNDAKELVGHGGWLKWVAKHCKGVSEDTAQRYMRLANTAHMRNLKDCKSLRQAYIAVGIIPEIEQPAAVPVQVEGDTTPTPAMRQDLEKAAQPNAAVTEATEPAQKVSTKAGCVPAMTMWNAWLSEGRTRLAEMKPAERTKAMAALKEAFKDVL